MKGSFMYFGRFGAAVLFVTALFLSPISAQTKLDSGDIVESLQKLETVPTGLTAALLRQQAIDSIRNRPGAALNRAPLSEQLNSLAQFTVEINFDFGSAVIRPESYRTVGRIADALHHPYLLGYKFLIVGHTDAKGGRETNLKLSQQRADAILEALTTTFNVPARRLSAVGLGEEQLRDPAHPEAATNRRVQLINIGKVS
jgi:OOP family OmpA-OmpF porin